MSIIVIAPLLCVIAYLIGSIPSAVIVCKLFKLPDPRQHGSLNPGTTNVLRIGGKNAAIVTLFADALKGFLPVLLTAQYMLHSPYAIYTQLLAASVLLCAFFGHLFPIFARFQGGKGVATLLGGLLGLSLMIGSAAILTWLLIAIVTRYSSLSAIIMAVLVPVYAALLLSQFTWIPLAILSIVLLWRHKDNVQRLFNGTESKIGKKPS